MPDTSPSTVSTAADATDPVGFRFVAGSAALLPLTHGMQVGDAGVAALAGIAAPAARAAIAFRVARRIEAATDSADVEPAIGAVAPAVEILDGRACRGFAVGQWRALADHLEGLVVELAVDDGAPDRGQSAGGAMAAALAGIAAAQRQGRAVDEGAILLIAWEDGPCHLLRPGATVAGRTEHIGQVSFFTQA